MDSARDTDRDIDEQIEALAATATSLSVAILRWGSSRNMPDAARVERDHQRRMVALRADGTIAVLCPVLSEAVAGIAIMTTSVEDTERIMSADPCVRAGMMTVEVHSCLGFPGDAISTPPACDPHEADGQS